MTRLPIKLEESRKSPTIEARADDASSGMIPEQPPAVPAGAQYGFSQAPKFYEQVGPKVAVPEDRKTSAPKSEVEDDGLTLFNAPAFENQETAVSAGNQIPSTDGLDRSLDPGRSSVENQTLDKTSIFGRAKRALTRTGGLEGDQVTTISKGVSVLETVESGPAPVLAGEPNKEEDALEIPAFLRRQSR